jgi:hypothetical protein
MLDRASQDTNELVATDDQQLIKARRLPGSMTNSTYMRRSKIGSSWPRPDT